MQAEVVGRRLSLRDFFTAVAAISLFAALVIRVRCPREALALRLAAA